MCHEIRYLQLAVHLDPIVGLIVEHAKTTQIITWKNQGDFCVSVVHTLATIPILTTCILAWKYKYKANTKQKKINEMVVHSAVLILTFPPIFPTA